MGLRRDADGVAVSDELPLNATVTGDQRTAYVAGLPGGGWVATWQGRTAASSGQNEVYYRRFDAGGQPLDAADRPANSVVSGYHGPIGVAANADGAFVIGWTRGINSGNPCEGGCAHEDAEVRVFDASGDPVGGEVKAAAEASSSDFSAWPRPSARGDGDFLVFYAHGGFGSYGVKMNVVAAP